jgi:hypothetical protein
MATVHHTWRALTSCECPVSPRMQGAGGPLMRDTITRVSSALSQGQEGAVERALRASYLVGGERGVWVG